VVGASFPTEIISELHGGGRLGPPVFVWASEDCLSFWTHPVIPRRFKQISGGAMSEPDDFVAKAVSLHVTALNAAHNGDPKPYVEE
jgi:hypothetical protein